MGEDAQENGLATVNTRLGEAGICLSLPPLIMVALQAAIRSAA